MRRGTPKQIALGILGGLAIGGFVLWVVEFLSEHM